MFDNIIFYKTQKEIALQKATSSMQKAFYDTDIYFECMFDLTYLFILDAILEDAFQRDEPNQKILINSILVHMGLLKVLYLLFIREF